MTSLCCYDGISSTPQQARVSINFVQTLANLTTSEDKENSDTYIWEESDGSHLQSHKYA